MGSAVSLSSPEPEARNPMERSLYILNQKPLRMAQMLRLSRIINDSSSEEKLDFFREGVLHRVTSMIAEAGRVTDTRRMDVSQGKGRQRKRSLINIKGVGYGSGSTKSHWDIERTVEERMAREERLVWLLNALTSYLYRASPDFSDPEEILSKVARANPVHVNEDVFRLLKDCVIPQLLDYHLRNESVFDISEHMELYGALLESACSLALYSELIEPLVFSDKKREIKSVVYDLLPNFQRILKSYLDSPKGQMASPDFRLVDFIQKVGAWSNFLKVAALHHSKAGKKPPRSVSAQRRYFKESDRPKSTDSAPELKEPFSKADSCDTKSLRSQQSPQPLVIDRNLAYRTALTQFQISTFKFIGDYGKLVVPFSFKKEAKGLNPFSPSLKERTKRIAKELASLQNALPLNSSNSIFVCVDEGRCDIMKVLITGPDDTPYQNGAFEFDIFFPSSYPFSAPKVAFLTTGGGTVRFNPNLYNDGKVCLSILGTWEGRPEEKWTPHCSLLQILISIQGLIFVKDPYFNEPGFERHMTSQKGKEYSRKYNQQIEHATLHYAIREQLKNPSEHFKNVTRRHFWFKRGHIIEQAQKWIAEVNKDVVKQQTSAPAKQSSTEVFEFGNLMALKGMERTIDTLIEELLGMPYPDSSTFS